MIFRSSGSSINSLHVRRTHDYVNTNFDESRVIRHIKRLRYSANSVCQRLRTLLLRCMFWRQIVFYLNTTHSSQYSPDVISIDILCRMVYMFEVAEFISGGENVIFSSVI